METVGDSDSGVEDWVEARDTLRRWREEGSRRSRRTCEVGRFLFNYRKWNLEDEVWSVYEQTCIASLDCGDISLAKDCTVSLISQFPESIRISRLSGLCLEAEEKYEEALDEYDKILEKHPNYAPVLKRKVSILKAQGKLVEAIKELNQFLLVFMTDSEAWLELTDLYVRMNELGRAGFCMEELILINPHHYLHHLKYAEICYSYGSADLARKHYATAVKLNPFSVRALYGFYLVCQVIYAKGKQSDFKSKFTDWVKMQIKRCYQFDDHKLRIVEKMLDKQF